MSDIKMSDVFKSASGKLTVGCVGRDIYQDIDHNMIDIVGNFETKEHASYAAHAINSHDSLVEQLVAAKAEIAEYRNVINTIVELMNERDLDASSFEQILAKHKGE